jgi:hypothetical protein
MEHGWDMVRFVYRGRFVADTPFQQLVVTTVLRSTNTFQAILSLLEQGLTPQAAILARPLFEDLVVGHWLVLNRSDATWLVERFFRHRDAMALHQRKVERETTWSLAQELPTSPGFASLQNALVAEFGGEAQKNWWDPGELGNGKGRPVGIRDIAARLEQAAADGVMFAPRFAGGDEPILRRMEQVAYKWFTQFLHHTAAGLPVQPMPHGDMASTREPGGFVLFATGWMFAQQVYLLHALYREGTYDFDHIFMAWFTRGYGATLDDLHWAYTYEDDAGMLTPTQLAARLWGPAQNQPRSPGARLVRKIAREEFPGDAPGKGGAWRLSPAQAERIRTRVTGTG